MIAVYILVALVGVLILGYFAGTALVIRKLMQPKKRTDAMLIEHETKEKRFDPAWLDIPFEEKWLDSPRGYRLRARLYPAPAPTHRYILLLHGHNSSGIGQLKYLPIFRSLGYHVLIPDHRFSGASGGKSITFGCYEKRDAQLWMDVLEREHPGATFALFGESMGAATATMLAGMDKRVRFLIEYCGYANFEQLTMPYLKHKALLKLVRPGMWLAAKVCYGVDLKEIDALSAMRSLTIPVLILHSKADRVVWFNNALAFMEANPNAVVKVFEDTAHARSWVKYPEEFTRAITDFVTKIDAAAPSAAQS